VTRQGLRLEPGSTAMNPQLIRRVFGCFRCLSMPLPMFANCHICFRLVYLKENAFSDTLQLGQIWFDCQRIIFWGFSFQVPGSLSGWPPPPLDQIYVTNICFKECQDFYIYIFQKSRFQENLAFANLILYKLYWLRFNKDIFADFYLTSAKSPDSRTEKSDSSSDSILLSPPPCKEDQPS